MFFAFGEATESAVFGLGSFRYFVKNPMTHFFAFKGDYSLDAVAGVVTVVTICAEDLFSTNDFLFVSC